MMECQYFEPVLDPVIVVCDEQLIRYLNPAAIKWLNISASDEFLNKPLGHFVDFSGTDEAALVDELKFFQFTKYGQSTYELKLTPFTNVAKIAFLRLPSDLNALRVAIFVRDRAFAQVLSDQEDIDVQKFAKPEMRVVEDPSASKVNTEAVVLDENTITRAMSSAERTAKFESQANLFFVEAKKACRGVTDTISDAWVQVIIKNFSGLAKDMKCNIEIGGNLKMRGFTTVGTVLDFRAINEDVVVRIQFGPISPMAQKALGDYLEVEAVKL